MMKVTWDTKTIEGINATVEDDKVMEFLGNLAALGFTGQVEMLDNTVEN